jgi:tetratricopeptide (TPR) repeat protein
MKNNDRKPSFTLLIQGTKCLSKGEYDQAIAKYDEVLRLEPNNTTALFFRGNAYDEKGHTKYNLDKAIADYTEVLRLEPNLSQAYYYRGGIYRRKKQYVMAIADYNEAIRIDSRHIDAYFWRGRLHENNGDIDFALKDYEAVQNIDPDSHYKIWAERNIQRIKNKIDILDIRIELGNRVFEDDEKRKKAILEYTKILQLDSNNADAYFQRGIIKWCDNILGAIEDFKDAIRLNPKNADYHYELAIAYYYTNRKGWALTSLNKTLRYNCNYITAYYSRAVLFYQKGDFEKAIIDFTKYLNLNFEDANVYHCRAVVHYRLGSIDKAIKDLLTSLQLNPNHNYQTYSRFLLEKIQKQK